MNLQQAQQTISDMDAHKITWDDNLRSQANNIISAADPTQQAMKIAQQAQQMQVQANQPAIQTLQGQQTNLSQSYSDLLKSVLGQGTVAMNSAIAGENTLLGQRGITDNTSPLYQQQLTQAELPVTAQNQSAAANVGIGSAQDINSIAAQIASLQAGNVPNALSFAGNISNIAQQSQLIPSQIGLTQAQTKQASLIPIPGLGVYNLSTGNIISNNGLSSSGRTIVGNYP